VIEIRITVQGEQRLRQAFADLVRSIQDYSPAWEVITRNFQRAMRGQFGSQGARGGKTWAPLSRAYSRWKERVAPGRPILILTGRLAESLVSEGELKLFVVRQVGAAGQTTHKIGRTVFEFGDQECKFGHDPNFRMRVD